MSARRYRICMVTTFYPPHHFGGDAIYVENLARELGRRGHEVHVVASADACRRPEAGGPCDPAPNVTVHRLGSRLGVLGPLLVHQCGRPVGYGGELRRLLDRGFDVIHYHNISLAGGPGVLALGRGLKLYTLHEYWLVCPTHVLYRNNRTACAHRRCLRCQLAYRRPPQPWRATRLLPKSLRHVDLLLAASRFTAEEHRRRGVEARIELLPHFVPAVTASAAGRKLGSGDPYVLFVGRLEKLKGLQDVLPVFRDLPARLLVAGTGGYEAELRRAAGGNPRIRFLGRLRPDDLAALYAAAVAVVVPSRSYEVAPLVMLESFRAGTPVVARELGSLTEYVTASGGGLLFSDASGLRDGLLRLLTDPEARDRMGRAARRAYEQHWSAPVHVERYLGLVERERARVAASRSPAG